MRPKSLSASALNVAELCLDRYNEENILRTPRIENDAASLGTVCHAALEQYVKMKALGPVKDPNKDWQLLKMFFHVEFGKMFGSFETSDARYKDGLEMLQRWLDRTDLENIDVVSCEVKSSFPVKTSIGDIPFNYIWDRFDRVAEREWKVVDYKSSRFNVTAEELKEKIQPRCYGLAAQIEKPDALKIWVEFDMLRYDRVGVVFTREDNAETWRFIKRMAERIIAEEDPHPTLNDECRFCVKRMGCSAALSNANSGGLISLDYMDDSDLSNLRALVEFQVKALKQNLTEIDKHLLSRARRAEVLAIDGDKARSDVKVRRSREVDPDRVRLLVGDAKFLQYGGSTKLTIASFDSMLKDPTISDEIKAKLKGLVFTNTGEPYISSKRKGSF